MVNMIVNRTHDGSFPVARRFRRTPILASGVPRRLRSCRWGPSMGGVAPLLLKSSRACSTRPGRHRSQAASTPVFPRRWRRWAAHQQRPVGGPDHLCAVLLRARRGWVLRAVALERLPTAATSAAARWFSLPPRFDNRHLEQQSALTTLEAQRGDPRGREATATPAASVTPRSLPLINDRPYPDYTSASTRSTGPSCERSRTSLVKTSGRFRRPRVRSNGQPIAPCTSRFSGLADNAVEGRILLGIHFRPADEFTRRQSRQIADQGFAGTHSSRSTETASTPMGESPGSGCAPVDWRNHLPAGSAARARCMDGDYVHPPVREYDSQRRLVE